MEALEGHALEIAEELKKLDPETQAKVVERAMGDHSVCRQRLEATGQLEPPPLRGVNYVVGSPPKSPLKGKKQPLFDTLWVPKSGFVDGPPLFSDCRKFGDGSEKVFGRDTNMTQNACLGYPLEYSVRWFELHFTDFQDAEDLRKVRAALRLTFVLGCNTPYLELPAGAWRPMLTNQPGEVNDAIAEGKVEPIRDYVRGRLDEFARKGIWTSYVADVGTKKNPKHLVSTESFRMDVKCEAERLSAPVGLKVLIQDTLYNL